MAKSQRPRVTSGASNTLRQRRRAPLSTSRPSPSLGSLDGEPRRAQPPSAHLGVVGSECQRHEPFAPLGESRPPMRRPSAPSPSGASSSR